MLQLSLSLNSDLPRIAFSANHLKLCLKESQNLSTSILHFENVITDVLCALYGHDKREITLILIFQGPELCHFVLIGGQPLKEPIASHG